MIGGELRPLHQLVVAALHVVIEDLVHLGALSRRGLHVDVVHLAVLVGEACVTASSQSGDGAHRLLVVDVEGSHHHSIHLEP